MTDYGNIWATTLVKPEVPIPAPPGLASPKEAGEPSFKEIVEKFLSTVNQLQLDAETKTRGLATGEVKNLHEVMIAAEKASLAMQFTMQIRNRLMEAYQEILRTQV